MSVGSKQVSKTTLIKKVKINVTTKMINICIQFFNMISSHKIKNSEQK
jgi:hypothetical protein